MKVVPLRTGILNSAEIFRAVLERASTSGLTVGDVRKRCHVLDLLASATDKLTLEDADHETLASAINSFSFGMATPDLLAVIDDVLNAGPSNINSLTGNAQEAL